MPRPNLKKTLADLRAAGVRVCDFDPKTRAITHLEFGDMPPAPAPAARAGRERGNEAPPRIRDALDLVLNPEPFDPDEHDPDDGVEMPS